MIEKEQIRYPIPGQDVEYYQDRKWYSFVNSNHPFMQSAKEMALKFSKTTVFPIGVVAVKNGLVIAEAGNGNGYHEENEHTHGHKKGCIRRFLSEERENQGLLKFQSGEGFELCPGCSTDFHAEANLIKSVSEKFLLDGAEVYMYGHFWCCESCWYKMEKAGITKVNLCNDIDFSNKENVKDFSDELKLYRKI